MAGNLHHHRRRGTHAAMARSSPSPRAALAVLTGLNFLELPRSLHPGGRAAGDRRGPAPDGRAGGVDRSWCFILAYAVDLAAVAGWLGDRRARLPLAAAGVFVWSVATFGSGLAHDLRAADRGARADRRRRGQLRGRHAVADLRLLPGGPPRARPGDVLRGDPDRLGARLRAGRRDQRALGLARGVLRRGRAGRGAGGAAAHVPGSAARRASTRRRRPSRRPALARQRFAALRARPSFLFNTLAQIIYTFAVGGLAAWMPTYFVRVRHLPLEVAPR